MRKYSISLNKYCKSGMLLAAIFAFSDISMAQEMQISPEAYVEASPAEMPDYRAQVVLIQSTLATLNDANLTGDYSVLLKRASSGFRQVNNEQQLTQSFESFRAGGIDMSAATIYTVRWSQAPELSGQMLRIKGAIESQPQEIAFDLTYVFENGWWRLAGISVGLMNQN